MKQKTKMLEKMIEKGLTFSQVADRLQSITKITATTVFQWADGRREPCARMKKAIAKVFECKVSDIF